jgi:hypothetical protein
MRLAAADHPASSGSLLGDQRWVFQQPARGDGPGPAKAKGAGAPAGDTSPPNGQSPVGTGMLRHGRP